MDQDHDGKGWQHPGQMFGGEFGEGLGVETYGVLALLIVALSAFALLMLV